ncbi:MAG: hypothetical protein ACPGQL_09815 [Thermoplasmatota archaeon]
MGGRSTFLVLALLVISSVSAGSLPAGDAPTAPDPLLGDMGASLIDAHASVDADVDASGPWDLLDAARSHQASLLAAQGVDLEDGSTGWSLDALQQPPSDGRPLEVADRWADEASAERLGRLHTDAEQLLTEGPAFHAAATSSAAPVAALRGSDVEEPLGAPWGDALARVPEALHEALEPVIHSLAMAADVPTDDLLGLEEARVALIASALEAAIVLPGLLPSLDSEARTSFGPCDPVIMLELEGNDSVHHCETLLLVDVGGNDHYLNRAAGVRSGAALVLDLAGDDHYEATATPGEGRGVFHGSSMNGIGVLVDVAGDDRYTGDLPDGGVVAGSSVGGAGALLDLAGDDLYAYEAGGLLTATGSGALGSGLLHDQAGDDRYDITARDAQVLGSSGIGKGLLVDAAGDDHYTTLLSGYGYVAGSSSAGQAALLDLDGHDRYVSQIALDGAAHGSSSGGASALLDLAGNDHYEGAIGDTGGINAGSFLGQALLFDGDGDDRYVATMEAWGGANGGALGGTALLLDVGGDDHYEASGGGTNAANGAGWGGVACLLDLAGDDTYQTTTAQYAAVSGAGVYGKGLLLDASGNDVHDASATGFVAAMGAGFIGAGILLDEEGHDGYLVAAVDGAGLGASFAGTGILVDGQGDDDYHSMIEMGGAMGATVPMIQESLPLPMPDAPPVGIAYPGGLGLLVDEGQGDDRYQGAGTVQGAAEAYGVGLLWEGGGINAFYAAADSFAQGAGRHFGIGLLVDRGTQTSLDLGPGAAGQGAGLQGLGLISRTEGTTMVTAGPGSRIAPTEGGGIGIRLELADAIGPGPDFSCPTSLLAELPPLPPASSGFLRVCQPGDDPEPILHPLTREPLEPLGKPSVDCRDGLLAATPCEAVITASLGAPAVTWLARDDVTMTTSGGLLHAVDLRVESGLASKTVLTIPLADRMCELSCDPLGGLPPVGPP